MGRTRVILRDKGVRSLFKGGLFHALSLYGIIIKSARAFCFTIFRRINGRQDPPLRVHQVIGPMSISVIHTRAFRATARRVFCQVGKVPDGLKDGLH